MTLQRQYSLPNCQLILEGLNTQAEDPLAPMTVLMNVECHLPGTSQGSLTGGREFLESLITAVNSYAQRLLSGVSRPHAKMDPPPLVELKPGEGSYHHLIVRTLPTGSAIASEVSTAAPLDIRLSTVQFFDLMEAIDQLLADSQTLPDLALNATPLSRRFVKPEEPIAKRAAPAVLGASTLAAAAVALFFVPPPQFEPSRTSEGTPSETVSTGDQAPEAAIPPSPPTGVGDETDVSTTETPADASATSPTAPAITDAATLETLRQTVTENLKAAWTGDPTPTEDLTYRISVAANGDILGYKAAPGSDAALANEDLTPLPKLTYTPIPGNEATPPKEPVAQFLTTFTPMGEVVVEPLVGDSPENTNSDNTDPENATPENATSENPDGELGSDANAPAEQGIADDIADPISELAQLERLNQQLRREIIDNRQPQTFEAPLTYRVRMTQAGDIIGYAATDAASTAGIAKTPLPALVSEGDTDLPQADFKVVFTEKGVVEVSPWNGWPR